MMSLPRELEIKLELTTEQMRRLSKRMRSNATSSARCTLHSTYFDTPDRALRSAGLSLRVRGVGGAWIQTLKADKAIVGGVSNPIELEVDVETCEPSIDAIADKKLRRKVKQLAEGSLLTPLFETVLDRTSIRIKTAGGDEIELALDLGKVCGGSREVRLREVEIELKSGNPAALLEIAREILGDGPARPSPQSKADRGYGLLGEDNATVLAPMKAEPAQIHREMASGEALREICRVTTAHALCNWQALVADGDAEAAHQLRIGLRRLRAALRILSSVVDDERMQSLASTAGELSRVVGRLRDIDVLMRDIVEPLAGSEPVAGGVAILRRRLARERKSRCAEVLEALATSRFGALRLELGLLPHLIGRLVQDNPASLDRPAEDLAHKALRRLLRHVVKRARDLSELTIEQRHELRKAIKPLRYGVEFFAPLYPRARTRRLLACLAELQTRLGYLNDVALAEQLLLLDWQIRTQEGEAACAIGAVIGWHTARAEQAWSDVTSTWKRFERAAQFLS